MEKQGFTMVEMMIVMLIIALLFMLTVPNVTQVLSIVQKKGCDAQLSVVDAAILQYFMIYDVYPQTLNQLLEEDLISHEQKTCQNGQTIIIENNQASLP
jgi:competence protein ComGC